MPRLITLLVMFVALQISFAQDQKTTISGVLTDFKSLLLINDSEVVPDQIGRFTYEFDIKKPTYVTIKAGVELVIFIFPGDSMILEANSNDILESMQYSGDSADINRFILEETKQGNKISQYINSNYKLLFSLKEEKWIEQIKSLCQPFKNRLNHYISENPSLDPFFIKSQNAMITYGCAELLLKYPGLHGDLTNNTEYKPRLEYYSFLDTLDINDVELLEVDEFRSFLKSFIEHLTEENQFAEPDTRFMYHSRFRKQLKIISGTFSNQDIRNEMLFAYMKPFIGEHNIQGAEDIIDSYRRLCTNKDYIEQIDQTYQADLEIRQNCEIVNYKTVGPISLEAFIYRPDGVQPGDRQPVVAFFHGGGWDVGKPHWGNWQCEHFKSRGLVAISFEYRLRSRHHTTPIESVADAKSAIRWIRHNADYLGIDPEKIVASGFSAGGHIAMCTAMVGAYDEPGEDLSISTAANAMMLWVTPARVFPGWFTKLLKGRAKLSEFDPDQLVRPGLPPMVFFQGTADNTVPAWTIKEFTAKMKKAGNSCELHLYPDQTHLGWGKNGDDVLQKMDNFLVSLGYL